MRISKTQMKIIILFIFVNVGVCAYIIYDNRVIICVDELNICFNEINPPYIEDRFNQEAKEYNALIDEAIEEHNKLKDTLNDIEKGK